MRVTSTWSMRLLSTSSTSNANPFVVTLSVRFGILRSMYIMKPATVS